MPGMNKIERLSPKLDSDVLRTFIVVAERGNVTHAAEELHRTQSAISVQIKRLESDLGVRLFEREARGMALTTVGEKLFASAKSIIMMLDRTAANLLQNPIEGAVTVGIPDDYGSELMAVILAEFAQCHPKVEVNIRCGFSVEFPKAVRRGQLDLAVYTGNQEDPNGEVLLEEQTVWVGRAGVGCPAISPLPVTLFDRTCWWRDAAIEALESSGIDYRIAYSSESVAGVKAAVKAGLAVGVLARSTIEPSMQVLGQADGLPRLPSSNLVLIWQPASRSSATTAMAEAIRRGFSQFIVRARP